MNKHIKYLAALIMPIILFGCASGNVQLTGLAREPINEDQIIIYKEAPENYEIIGTVEASSEAGTSIEKKQNHAIKKILKEAAKVGANGVIVKGVESKETAVSVHGGGRGTTNIKTSVIVSAFLIYVPQKL